MSALENQAPIDLAPPSLQTVPATQLDDSPAIDKPTGSKNTAWLLEMVQVLWSAGPVTYVALNVGHWVAFGEFAMQKQFIYFGYYTLIAGLTTFFTTKLIRQFHKRKSSLLFRKYNQKHWHSIRNQIDALEKCEQERMAEIIALILSSSKK